MAEPRRVWIKRGPHDTFGRRRAPRCFIVDSLQRARVLNAADAKLARAVPVPPMSQTIVRAAIRDRVRGVLTGDTQFNFFQNTEDWWLAASR